MLTVSKSGLKARMLEYFRQVEQTGEPLIVTSHGKPVLKVVPLQPKRTVDAAFAEIRKKAEVYGDLCEPETAEWGMV